MTWWNRSKQGEADVPEAWRTKIELIAGHLGDMAPSGGAQVSQAVAQFVLDGGPDAVLGTLRQLIWGSHAAQVSHDQRARLYLALPEPGRALTSVPAPVALRYLKLVGVLAWSSAPRSGRGLLSPGSWIYQLVRGERWGDPGLTFASLEALQVAAGWEPHTLLTALVAASGVDEGLLNAVLTTPDLAEALLRHRDHILGAVPTPIKAEGAVLGRLLVAAPAAVPAFAQTAADLLTSSSKHTRSAATGLLTEPTLAAEGPLREALLTRTRAKASTERVLAFEALRASALASGDRAFLQQLSAWAAADGAASVRRLAEQWGGADGEKPGDGVGTDSGVSVELPPMPELDWRIRETPQLRARVERLWKVHPATGSTPEQFLADLLSDGAVPPRRGWGGLSDHIVTMARFAEFGPTVLSKAIAMVSSGRLRWDVDAVLREASGPMSLDAVAALLAPFALTPRQVLEFSCHRWSRCSSLVAPSEAWTFALRHPDAVLDMLRAAPTSEIDRSRLFAVLAAAPALPGAVVDELFGIALGAGVSERGPAQRALASVPGKRARIRGALADGRGDVRAAAARWLGELGDTDDRDQAVAALEAAFAKEKQDVVKAAMLDALEALGCRAEDYLDLAGWERDAAKAASKPVPAALDWLDWASLPPLTWGEGTQRAGEPVPVDVVRHLVVQAVKAKASEPNAMLRRYCALWDEAGRQVLADALLRAWIAQDVAPIPPEQAQREAAAGASTLHADMRRYPSEYSEHEWLGWSEQQIAAALLAEMAKAPAGSAIASKGLLAAVAACGTGALAPPVERYLKQWYGHRPAQCKALLGMLAWVDDPAAIALLLSVGNRFRTAGIQDEAGRLVQELAARKSWTIDELADRTIPTAGLEPDGTLALDYGPRQFTAHLRPDLTLGLRDPDGKEIKALPAARVSDDEDLAAAAKKAFSAAKKALSTTVKQQTERLEEALCTGRTWAFADWQQYLLGHPIVRHLVGRLVWMQVDDSLPDGVVPTLRPLDDGTLTDADDEPVALAPDARIRLAHDAHLPETVVEAWSTHLADYQVTPPFAQLGAGFWRLPEALAGQVSLQDFEGHVLEAFALRGRAGKLGWTRGQAQDGGFFCDYSKRYPTLGLEAVLEFTGNSLPEEPRLVALRGLSFARIGGGASGGGPTVPLGDVPAVLLSRCRADVAAMAAEGTGFDPDWEKTVSS